MEGSELITMLCERYSHCIFSSCSIDLTKTRNTWSLTAVIYSIVKSSLRCTTIGADNNRVVMVLLRCLPVASTSAQLARHHLFHLTEGRAWFGLKDKFYQKRKVFFDTLDKDWALVAITIIVWWWSYDHYHIRWSLVNLQESVSRHDHPGSAKAALAAAVSHQGGLEIFQKGIYGYR